MSFSKAKIHRFNEDTTCAPPPGRYDPKLDTKIKGAALPISKRFPDQLCTSSSLDSLDKSISSQPTFRTPQLLRRMKMTPKERSEHVKSYLTIGGSGSISSCKSEEKLLSGTKKEITRSDYKRLENELAACEQKLTERKSEMNKLKEDLEKVKISENELKLQLEEKNNQMECRSKELLEVKNCVEILNEKVNQERQDHQICIDTLNEEINMLQTKKEDLETALLEKQNAVDAINEKCSDLERELEYLLEKSQNYLDDIVRIEETNLQIVNNIVTQSEQKIEQLEGDLKTKVRHLEQDFDDAHQKVKEEYQTKLNVVSHDFELKTQEMQVKMRNCFSSIKDLKKLVSDKEKEFSQDIEEANERCKYMYRELCKIEGQRDDLLGSDLEKKLAIVELTEKANNFEEDVEQCKDKCKRYEITLNTMQETIKALSVRLVESENEVERLSKVESDLETQKMILEEKSQLLLSDITALREGMDKMEKEIICDVTALQEHLIAKAELFKVEASKQIGILNNKIDEKQCAIDLLLSENSYLQNECERKSGYIRDLENKVTSFNEEISDLKGDYSKREEDFSEKLNAQKNLCKILNDNLENANRVNQQTTNLLKSEIRSQKEVIEKKLEIETKQRHYIDELISNLVLEQKRYESLEKEKNEITDKLCCSVKSNEETSKKVEELVSKLETMDRSLKNAEEKITVIEDAKSIVENQFVESENTILKLKATIAKLEEQNEVKIKEFQSLLKSSKDEFEVEISKLEHDNINKAERILELSMTIDGLKETITGYEINIACLEAEQNKLKLNLADACSNISALESALDSKNMTINSLMNQLNITETNYDECLVEIDKLHGAINKHNEEFKLNTNISIQLSEAEEKIVVLQEKLSLKEAELESQRPSFNVIDENNRLKNELEKTKLRLQIVTEEKEKLDRELTELMGHQNIHQKIKHVNQLKQMNIELKQKNNDLEIENKMLKKKIDESKENTNVLWQDESPKSLKKKSTRKVLSPVVLKDRNNR